MCKESTGRQDHSDTGGSTMADSSLFFTNNADIDRHNILVQARDNLLSLPYKETVHLLRKTMNLMICQISGNSLLVKEYLLKQPISCYARGDKVLKKQYKVFVKRWFQYCGERKISEIQISLATVLDFLTSLFENGLGYSSINTARSALSALGLMFDNVLVGAHPLVIRFMKGVFNLRPGP